MNRKHLLTISGLAILILSVQVVPAYKFTNLGIPILGVKNGDSFSYVALSVVTKGPSFEDSVTGDLIKLKTGDEFTLTILNSTPFVNFNEDFRIEVKIENENKTVQTDLGVGIDRSGRGNFFSSIDRILWEDNMTISNTTSAIYPTESIYFTENTIIYKFEITKNETYNEDFNLMHALNEDHYDRTSGALLYHVDLDEQVFQNSGYQFLSEFILLETSYTDFEIPNHVWYDDSDTTISQTSSETIDVSSSKSTSSSSQSTSKITEESDFNPLDLQVYLIILGLLLFTKKSEPKR